MPLELTVRLRVLHPMQALIKASTAKRKIVRAGRRGGKTVFAADWAVENFLDGKRVLYGVPTSDQLQKFWFEVTRALAEPIEKGIFKMDKTMHTIEKPGTENRIRAKTCWNADTLRGDYADRLALDEIQLMAEDTWGTVGAPMLLDNNGDSLFIYTPPSLHSRSTSKAKDKGWIRKFAKQHANDPKGRWEIFSFTSHDNPYISSEALADITDDMSATAIRQEIYAEDMDEAPGALWHRQKTQIGTQWVLGIEDNRVFKTPELTRVIVGVDPSGSSTGDACGIIAAGIDVNRHHYTIEDNSIQGSPDMWAREACKTYYKVKADVMVAEKNYGGEMVEKVIKDTDPIINVKLVSATRGKAVRAEPISALTERGTDHMVGTFPDLEDELCLWVQGDKSPNRLDAKVWADTELSRGGNASDLVDFA
ncbi:MAG: hypothetical protein ABII09_12500 [Planctomycetota bacterium]